MQTNISEDKSKKRILFAKKNTEANYKWEIILFHKRLINYITLQLPNYCVFLTMKTLLENISVKAKTLCDQVDWFSSLEEELIQVQEDLSFYNDILGEFTAEDIASLEMDSRDDITQENSTVMITADAVVTANITADVVILDNADIATDSGT